MNTLDNDISILSKDILTQSERGYLTCRLNYITLLGAGTTNAKLKKGDANYFLSFILYLAPYNIAGINVCPWASEGCVKACLCTAGRGRFNNVQKSRLRKTLFFKHMRKAFIAKLFLEIEKAEKKAEKLGVKCVIRLNGTSDLPIEKFKHEGRALLDTFPNVQFYDYSKSIDRAIQAKSYDNYSVTFSASEKNHTDVIEAIYNKVNVAVVFNKLPEKWGGIDVINGDKHDYRFLDRQGVIVGLIAKGEAKKDNSGFVKWI